jgi:hypothetical protein
MSAPPSPLLNELIGQIIKTISTDSLPCQEKLRCIANQLLDAMDPSDKIQILSPQLTTLYLSATLLPTTTDRQEYSPTPNPETNHGSIKTNTLQHELKLINNISQRLAQRLVRRVTPPQSNNPNLSAFIMGAGKPAFAIHYL